MVVDTKTTCTICVGINDLLGILIVIATIAAVAMPWRAAIYSTVSTEIVLNVGLRTSGLKASYDCPANDLKKHDSGTDQDNCFLFIPHSGGAWSREGSAGICPASGNPCALPSFPSPTNEPHWDLCDLV